MTNKEKYCLYEVGSKVMLKSNLLIVEIVRAFNNKNKTMYAVRYPHLQNPHTFDVEEKDLEERPADYNQIIFNAYIDYRYKYEELCRRLYSASVREKY